MKKLSSILLAVLLALCMAVGFLACETSLNEPQDDGYCDPKGKVWYNRVSLPNLSDPFIESYDGIYSIEIDNSGKVVFKPSDGVILNGDLTASKSERQKIMNISIQFEDGTTATGTCYKTDNDFRGLSIYYLSKSYYFTGKRQYTKQEVEDYRSQLIQLLVEVYNEERFFPSQNEIKSNDLYKEYTDFSQVDPCCGGPITYTEADSAVIEDIYDYYDGSLTIYAYGQRFIGYIYPDVYFAVIKDGKLYKLSASEMRTGQCLIVRLNGGSQYIKGVIYVED